MNHVEDIVPLSLKINALLFSCTTKLDLLSNRAQRRAFTSTSAHPTHEYKRASSTACEQDPQNLLAFQVIYQLVP
jgi:hypothetical protein